MPERKQPFDVRLMYPGASRELRLRQARLQERAVEIDLSGLQRSQPDGTELRAAMALGRGKRLRFPNVVADGQHEKLLCHLHGLLIGFALRCPVPEIGEC